MYTRTSAEAQQVTAWMAEWFGKDFAFDTITDAETAVIVEIEAEVDTKFKVGLKYIVGTALDYTLMAQALADVDKAANAFQPDLTEFILFDRYKLVTKRAGKTANTLTLTYTENNTKKAVGMRRYEESVVELLRGLGRGYPSAYVYNTGQWRKTVDLLVRCFQLSASGRYRLCQNLVDYALTSFDTNAYYGRAEARVRLFPMIISDYPRSAKGENGGLTLQAVAYAFFYADRQHLEFAVDKVRTGSSRQNRFGDIDGYYGLDLELSVEVKDMEVTFANLVGQVGSFLGKVRGSHIKGIVFAVSVTEDAAATLAGSDVTGLSLEDVQWIVETWDWPKQDRAVHAMLHYLAHVEQSASATKRLLAFVRGRDANHPSLAYAGTEEVTEGQEVTPAQPLLPTDMTEE